MRAKIWPQDGGLPIVGYTKNVSIGGLFITAPRSLARGSRMRVELHPEGVAPFMLEGRVVWAKKLPQELRHVQQGGMAVRALALKDLIAQVKVEGEKEENGEGKGSGSLPSVASSAATSHGRSARSTQPMPKVQKPLSPTVEQPAPPPSKEQDDEGKHPVFAVKLSNKGDFVRLFRREIARGVIFVRTENPVSPGTTVVVVIHPPNASPQRLLARAIQGEAPGLPVGDESGMLVKLKDPKKAIDELAIYMV